MPSTNTPSDSYGELRELFHEVTSAEVEVEQQEPQPLRPFDQIIVVPPRASRGRKKRNQ